MNIKEIVSAPLMPASSHGRTIALGPREFVFLMAASMALVALSIDIMLPALPLIGDTLQVGNPNHTQWVISVFLLGAGVGSLLFGPLSDRYGRRPVLLGAILAIVLIDILCAATKSFPLLLAGRFAVGVCAAACRIVPTGIIRDRFSGNDMARMLSLTMLIFLLVPMIAPTLGQLLLVFAPWRVLFLFLACVASALLTWILLRLPETLAPANRVMVTRQAMTQVFRRIVRHPVSMPYAAGAGIMMGAQTGFLLSIHQIVSDVFGEGDRFGLIFALIVIGMAVGSLFNSALVRRVGARRLSHGAVIGILVISLMQLVTTLLGLESLVLFCICQSLVMLSVAFAGSNISAIAMEPFSRGAGQAASIIGFLSSLLSVSIGSVIGGAFDYSSMPLTVGNGVCAGVTVCLILLAEKGRLFRDPHRRKR